MSVCLSVRHTLVLYQNEQSYRYDFSIHGEDSPSFFQISRPSQLFIGEMLASIVVANNTNQTAITGTSETLNHHPRTAHPYIAIFEPVRLFDYKVTP